MRRQLRMLPSYFRHVANTNTIRNKQVSYECASAFRGSDRGQRASGAAASDGRPSAQAPAPLCQRPWRRLPGARGAHGACYFYSFTSRFLYTFAETCLTRDRFFRRGMLRCDWGAPNISGAIPLKSSMPHPKTFFFSSTAHLGQIMI